MGFMAPRQKPLWKRLLSNEKRIGEAKDQNDIKIVKEKK